VPSRTKSPGVAGRDAEIVSSKGPRRNKLSEDGRRGTPLARRDDRASSLDVREKQRSQREWIGAQTAKLFRLVALKRTQPSSSFRSESDRSSAVPGSSHSSPRCRIFRRISFETPKPPMDVVTWCPESSGNVPICPESGHPDEHASHHGPSFEEIGLAYSPALPPLAGSWSGRGGIDAPTFPIVDIDRDVRKRLRRQ